VGGAGTVSDAEGTGEEAVSGASEHEAKSGGGRAIDAGEEGRNWPPEG
jgi:hypothetical protein